MKTLTAVMPTLLATTLAMVALFPLTHTRPNPQLVVDPDLPAYSTTTMDTLMSCIEEDTFISNLKTCMQYDTHSEEITTDEVSFSLLDSEWHRLQLLRNEFVEDLRLKHKLVRVFQELLSSFYQAQFSSFTNELDTYNNVNPYNSSKNDNISEIKGTTWAFNNLNDTTESLDRSSQYTTSTTSLPKNMHPSKVDSSKEISYEEAGSDPEPSVVHPVYEVSGNSVILFTDGPYSVSRTTSEKGLYKGDHEVATSEFGSPTDSKRHGIDSFDSSNHSTKYLSEITTVSLRENENTDYEAPSSGERNMGTDVDENEIFPPIQTTVNSKAAGNNAPTEKSSVSDDSVDEIEIYPPIQKTINTDAVGNNFPTEISLASDDVFDEKNYIFSTIHTTINTEYDIKYIPTEETSFPSVDYRINNNYNTSPYERNTEGPKDPTENNHRSTQYSTTIPNDRLVTENRYEQTHRQTDDHSLNEMDRQQPISKEQATSGSDYIKVSPYTVTYKKEHELDTEYSSGPVSYTVMPTDPTKLLYDPNDSTQRVFGTDNSYIAPLSVSSNLDSTSERESGMPSRIFPDYGIVLYSKPLTNLADIQSTSKKDNIKNIYNNVDFTTTEMDDFNRIFSEPEQPDVSKQIPSISPLPPAEVSKSGEDESEDSQTQTYRIYTADFIPGEPTILVRDPFTFPIEQNQITINQATTEYAYSSDYDENRSSYDTRGSTTLDGTLDGRWWRGYTSETQSGTALSPTPQPKGKYEFPLDIDLEYDQKPTSTESKLFDDHTSETKITDDNEMTTEYKRLLTINTVTAIDRSTTTSSLDKVHNFSIPLLEVQKPNQANAIANTLTIQPWNNDHMTIFQPSYKHNCISNNDCVRVGSVLNQDSKQRRTSNFLESRSGGDNQLLAGDLDSVLWWHKMRALKKKFR